MKLSRREFLSSIAQLANGYRQLIESECSGFPTDPDARVARVKKALAADGFQFFVETYFPHYVRTKEPSLLHLFLFQRLPKIIADTSGKWLALAAPRGEAKSTIVSQLFVLWCIVRGVKHYVPIIMDSQEQACTMLEAIKAELECNPRLQMDFPKTMGSGRVWNVGTIITANDIKVQAFGSGKRIRGIRHGPHRPDLVILDDIENDENVRSPAQRDKLEGWLNKSVLKLGPPDGTMDVVYIGTILHYDSVLARTLKKPMWESRVFRAIVQWPENMRLWDQWEEALRNDGEAKADAFYRKHKVEMDRGAVASWPAARPLLALMKSRADDHAAFDSEFQNDPVNVGAALFGTLHFWVNRLDNWIFYGACDPSLGKHGTGRDPSAILVGGFSRATGVLDVVDADIKKRLPDRIIEDILSYHQQYRCLVWAIESVQFQEFFRTELVKRSAARGIPVPARAVIPHADKALRIESLQPHVANGLIRFYHTQATLLEQLRHYPMADHDDGPDALHMLWTLAIAGASFAIPKTVARPARQRFSRY
ncbi:MAG: phage terminase large subunit [Burkholderiales bacterium]|jgi:predicted phage terminase large subunit-like protein|nr:phage terminase large subunit [Burkholderiales bacterium]